jgi:hypothetical protein
MSSLRKIHINLGDRVEDKISQYKGRVIAITHWLAGCVRVSVQPEECKDGVPVDARTFDVEQLTLVESMPPIESTPTGGSQEPPTRNPDPV